MDVEGLLFISNKGQWPSISGPLNRLSLQRILLNIKDDVKRFSQLLICAFSHCKKLLLLKLQHQWERCANFRQSGGGGGQFCCQFCRELSFVKFRQKCKTVNWGGD